jgi:hypothetical protein
MQLLKVTQLNDDGSIAFEALLPPEEAKLVLEVGINVLIGQGIMAGQEEEYDEEEDENDFPDIEGPDTLQ